MNFSFLHYDNKVRTAKDHGKNFRCELASSRINMLNWSLVHQWECIVSTNSESIAILCSHCSTDCNSAFGYNMLNGVTELEGFLMIISMEKQRSY